MDAAFLTLVAFSLAFVSLLIIARMRSLGAPSRRVAQLVAELWIVFALWVGVLWAVAMRIGSQSELGGTIGATDMGRNALGLRRPEQGLLAVSLLLGIAVFVHFVWALPRRMRDAGDG